jgi:prephenate dehydrogenase
VDGPAAGSDERDDIRVPAPSEPDAAGFRSVAVIGVGLIGASVALAARRAWPWMRVAGVDRGTALDAARFLTAFDALGDTTALARQADLVVLAAPVRQNIHLLRALGSSLEGPTLVTDVGSTKRATIAASAELPGHVSFVGGHPMAGAARGGLGLARADLFAGRPWLLTPSPSTRSPKDVDRVAAFVTGLGAHPRVLDADTHDRLFAFVSHLPQLTASALMHTVGTAVGADIDLAGPGLADTTRLASSPADIWQDICATNGDDIRPALDALIDSLQTLREGLENDAVIARLFESAQRWRERVT